MEGDGPEPYLATEFSGDPKDSKRVLWNVVSEHEALKALNHVPFTTELTFSSDCWAADGTAYL